MVVVTYPKECEVVQPAPPRGRAATPLFLLHDGGGTTFAYHCLSPLDRAVFGIANPRFTSGTEWPGGVPEMARAYLRMIRNTVAGAEYPPMAPCTLTKDGRRRWKILLGGWSLGGLLSLEIARLLVTGKNEGGVDEGAGDGGDEVEIVGLVMIDSVCPVWPVGSEVKIGTWIETEVPEHKNLKLARRAMKLAGGMVKVWKMPRCGAAFRNGVDYEVSEEGKDVEKSFYGSRAEKETAEVVWDRPPRGVLVRASDCVPMPGEGISPVDVYRGDAKLGWDGYCPGYVEKTFVTKGNHFDMFAWGYVDEITERVAEACRYLEG
ncbi:Nonribosomal peptide synthetase imqB [Colletotrichum aenigma]|uniref:Nonribosomal peptide synthetase imqB n=1 Tax=Colletotrichum aenigma TaxID=1215731 RepID=UPI0018732C6B|nr:Nonribosomal peptide synthetase imqB [Colletotrichum aenigma]KAF5519952.1 Nonribosomal peptide synthetase imqB [Colletotrichum aenigma]